jgi:hypothetical protein
MADPFNYNIASPMAAFEGSYNFAQAQEQKQRAELAAREKQAQQLIEQQKVQTALESIMKDRTPENLARNLLLVPSIKEQVLASESILSEAEKTANNQFRAEVIGLAKSGNIDAAKARLTVQAEGYRNTPGKEKEAAAAQALLKTWDINPESVILPMTIQLAESNKDLYKILFDAGELTEFQKNQVAAGINPKSPQGIAQSQQFLELKIDPIVEMVTPDNVKFVGPRSEYFRRYGPNAQEPVVKAPPTVGEVRGGFKFNGGNPADKNNWSKVATSGGKTSETQSGNFQGQ